MIHIARPQDCCGCTACFSICNHDAIIMKSDVLGFLYPEVDDSKCIKCGLCLKVCQFHDNYKRYDNYNLFYVYKHRLKNLDQLKRSQSGGAFFAIAKSVLNNDGIVVGAAFDNIWNVTHQIVTNTDDLERLRMSKYVQSDIRGCFSKIKDELKQGKRVLFSGTACQVAGLKAYIPIKLHTNLFCVDIICHGVPSPKIWADYITYLESHYKSKIVKACFRDKRFGWHGAKETFKFANGKEIVRKTNNYLYFSGLTLRESCTNCKFTNTNRIGDITIGDFWGLPKDSLYEKDKKGLSLLMVNSLKGEYLLNQIRNNSFIEECSINSCMQPQLKYPTSKNLKQEDFINDYAKYGFIYVANKYGDIGWRYYVKTTYLSVRAFLGRILRYLGLRKKINV